MRGRPTFLLVPEDGLQVLAKLGHLGGIVRQRLPGLFVDHL